MNKPMFKLRNLFFILVLVIVTGRIGYELGKLNVRWQFNNWKPALVSNKDPNPGVTSGQQVDFNQFWLAWDKLSQKYVDKTKLDAKTMVDGAISGMVASIGDPYTVYLPLKQNEASKEDLNGSFSGVGMELGFNKDNQLIVVTTIDGSPAKAAGVKTGDMILKIEDEPAGVNQITKGISIPEAVKIIRGKKGTPVKLTLARESGDLKPFEVSLVRDTIIIKSVTLEWQSDHQVALIKLSKFGDRTQDEWNEAVTQVLTDKPKAMVLDLRGNPGGYLEGAVFVAGEFLPAGKVVVTQQYGDGRRIVNPVRRNGRLLDIPMVVLVNQGSASAAEILAGALQDYGRAKILGEKSFGKGSVQEPEDFGDGSGIHITVAKWLRPSEEWIDKIGVLPDVEVKPNESNSDDPKDDAQLQKALEILSKI